ncbi:hypothetical protein WS71_24500 [Burkholderia mayonis]|uniref:Uncharacterized protein n=2 Tax=Burkholderia mayonis TaxID=1385591 RepID=A0A1B4G379_9BURK|nr:hypothetical protein WS71_24500 [Burkholderia mayonis]KVE53648.1 hypothetical protein WS71_06280 [Burkholderia mayonis]
MEIDSKIILTLLDRLDSYECIREEMQRYMAVQAEELEKAKTSNQANQKLAHVCTFIDALKIADDVFEQYRQDQPKWWRRMDGTPILNDVAVRMAEAYIGLLSNFEHEKRDGR